ncbi:hypothetical protein ACXIZ1_12080 [Klebsiella pneumoniae]
MLRTLSGLRFCSPGKRSATGGRYTPHSKKPRTFRDGVLFKRIGFTVDNVVAKAKALL